MFLIIIRLIIIKDYVIGICLQQLHWFYKPFLTVIRREEAEWMSNFVKLKLKLSLLNSFCSYIYIYIYIYIYMHELRQHLLFYSLFIHYYLYITLILPLWDLSTLCVTLCVVHHLYTYTFLSFFHITFGHFILPTVLFNLQISKLLICLCLTLVSVSDTHDLAHIGNIFFFLKLALNFLPMSTLLC